MRDHITEELISAYVDSELEGDELTLVERLLAESAEHRQLLVEFQAVRASIGALPNLNLPADFHTRVVDQINERAVSPAKESVPQVRREPKTSPWRGVLLAAASLAAVVALTVMLRPPTPTPSIPGPPGSVITPVALPVFFQQVPNYVMVYDVTVTPAGHRNMAVDKVLKNLGIGIDPALRLDGRLEKALTVIRESKQMPGQTEATPYRNDPAAPPSNGNDRVEMIYVASTIGVLDQFGRRLEQMSAVGAEISHLHYDLAIEPNKVGVMHRLHDTAREHFAQRTNIIPSDAGQAFRLSFRFELTSVSVPGAAKFPMLTVSPEPALSGVSGSRELAGLDVSADGTKTAADAAGAVSRLNQPGGEVDRDSGKGIDGGGQPANWSREPGHILLIVRYVGANAVEAR